MTKRSDIKLRLAAVLCVAALATGCSTFTTPRYSISAESNVVLKAINATGVSVGAFSYAGPGNFDNFCRGAGTLEPVDGISHVEYIRRAIESELNEPGTTTPTRRRRRSL